MSGTDGFDLALELRSELEWPMKFAHGAKRQYTRWLELKVWAKDTCSADLAPSPTIELIWEIHRKWTMDYVCTCEDMGASFIHHFPRAMRDVKAREVAYARTLQAYKSFFGEDPPHLYWEPFGARSNGIAAAALAKVSAHHDVDLGQLADQLSGNNFGRGLPGAVPGCPRVIAPRDGSQCITTAGVPRSFEGHMRNTNTAGREAYAREDRDAHSYDRGLRPAQVSQADALNRYPTCSTGVAAQATASNGHVNGSNNDAHYMFKPPRRARDSMYPDIGHQTREQACERSKTVARAPSGETSALVTVQALVEPSNSPAQVSRAPANSSPRQSPMAHRPGGISGQTEACVSRAPMVLAHPKASTLMPTPAPANVAATARAMLQQGYVLRPLRDGEKRTRGRPRRSDYVKLSELTPDERVKAEQRIAATEAAEAAAAAASAILQDSTADGAGVAVDGGGVGSRDGPCENRAQDSHRDTGVPRTASAIGGSGTKHVIFKRGRGRPRKDGSWPIPRALRNNPRAAEAAAAAAAAAAAVTAQRQQAALSTLCRSSSDNTLSGPTGVNVRGNGNDRTGHGRDDMIGATVLSEGADIRRDVSAVVRSRPGDVLEPPPQPAASSGMRRETGACTELLGRGKLGDSVPAAGEALRSMLCRRDGVGEDAASSWAGSGGARLPPMAASMHGLDSPSVHRDKANVARGSA